MHSQQSYFFWLLQQTKACGIVQITTVDEAKTFYPLFGLGANVALIFSGRAVKYFSQVCPGLHCAGILLAATMIWPI